MSDLQPSQIDKLSSYLSRAIDWSKRKFYNLGAVYSDLFSTNKRPSGQRIEVTPDGIFGYDDYGTQSFAHVTDSNLFYKTTLRGHLRIISGNIELDTTHKIGSGNVYYRFADNGGTDQCHLFYVGGALIGTFGIVGGGTNQIEFLLGVKVTGGSIEVDDTRRIGHAGTYHRFFDNGAGTTFHGFYVNGALVTQLNANDLDLNAVNLKLNNAVTAITTEVVTNFVTIKDSSGTTIKLAVVV